MDNYTNIWINIHGWDEYIHRSEAVVVSGGCEAVGGVREAVSGWGEAVI